MTNNSVIDKVMGFYRSNVETSNAYMWKISRSQNFERSIYSCWGDEFEHGECETRLRSSLKSLDSGRYYIRLKNKVEQSRGFAEDNFFINEIEDKPAPIGRIENQKTKQEEIQEAIKDALFKYQIETEIIQLRAKVKELESENKELSRAIESPVLRIMQTISGAMPLQQTQQAQISGEELTALQQRSKEALDLIRAKFNSDEAFINGLESLASACQNAETWAMLSGFLNKKTQ